LNGGRLAVTSAVRYAGPAEFSGFLRIVDLERAEVLAVAHVPESRRRADDPNPRGGLRGAKGIGAHEGRFVLANADTLFVYDEQWSRIGEITHPFLGSIHDLLVEPDGIWIACANSDLLVRMGWNGELLDHWSWRTEPELVAALGFQSVPRFDPALDFRDPKVMQGGVHNIVHLNSVSRSHDGLVLSFGRVLDGRTLRTRMVRGRLGRAAAGLGLTRSRNGPIQAIPSDRLAGSSYAVVGLSDADPRQATILYREGPIQVPNHNATRAGELLVFNDSNRGRLVFYSLEGELLRSVEIPGFPSFARGLVALGEGVYVVGSQAPLALHVVDPERETVLRSIPLGGLERESVYAVCALPAEFATPGDRFLLEPAASASEPLGVRGHARSDALREDVGE
jgi:hypothetical protein